MRARSLLAAIFGTVSLCSLGCSGDYLVDSSTGTVRVVIETGGDDPDPDGYTVQVDGSEAQPAGLTASIDLDGLAAGNHTVTLAGVASNCGTPDGLNRMVTVSERTVAVARFTVGCSAVAGSIEIVTATNGESLDRDGFRYKVDELPAGPIGTTGSTTVTGLAAGTHTVTLQDLASNCSVPEGTSRTLDLVSGAPATVQFAVTCSFIGVTVWKSIPLPPSVQANISWTSGRTLWGSSASDLFVAASTGSPASRFGIWHWDGSSWTEQVSRADTSFSAVWGFSGRDVYAVGNRASYGSTHPGAVLHFDGSSWSDLAGPAIPDEGAFSLFNAVWGAQPDDLLLGGGILNASSSTHLLARYNGNAWTRMTAAVFGEQAQFSDIAGTSGSDVWAIGSRRTETCEDCNDVLTIIGHFDGHEWTNSFSEPWYVYGGIWAVAPNDVWVAGQDDASNGFVLHYDGSGWTEREPLSTSVYGLQDVWGSSSTDVYAVGPRILLHYDGHAWKRISEVGGDRVWGTSRNDVFILRANEVLHGRP